MLPGNGIGLALFLLCLMMALTTWTDNSRPRARVPRSRKKSSISSCYAICTLARRAKARRYGRLLT